ncbi:MAG: 16S rRNA processing protein RimM [Silvanigrellales bacterium]|nr:16S rRNA processing protein RimM [Silvanigrellales bacterium]
MTQSNTNAPIKALNPRERQSPRNDLPGEGWLTFARVGRPHGLKGAFFLKTDDNRTEWDGYRDLRLEVEGGFSGCRVTKSYVSGGALAVQLDVFGSRTEVEAFSGARICVHRSEIALEADEHLTGDLVGLQVVDETGTALGKVAGVASFGAQDNLRIVVPGRKEEVLFPYIEGFVLKVDVGAGTVTVRHEPVFFEETTEAPKGSGKETL